MRENFRSFLNLLEENGELIRIKREVDPRYMSALVSKSSKAVLMEKIKGYDIPVVSNIIGTRRRVALALQTSEAEIAKRFQESVSNFIHPVIVGNSPAKEVVIKGEEVDLTKFPLPLISEKDGGPYISSGVLVAKDPEYGRNVGMYRHMYREKNIVGIDLVSPSDLRSFYSRALERGEPLEIAIAIGVHPNIMFAAGYKAPPGVDEFTIAGGLFGEPVELVKCETVDLEVPADSEIVLEGEILPVGWVEDEGRFGDFTGFECELKWNPVIKIKAITHRKNPIFYMLHMPWENDFIQGPATEANVWRALKEASVEPRAVYATPGGACYWHVVASIKKRAGEGKNALLAMLSVAEVKLAVVTDEDVNIFDPVELERAIAFRVQADKDVVIVSGARGKHLDPSVRAWEFLPKGLLPTTAKLGIDATIPEGIPKERYERLKCPFFEEVRLEDYLGE
jgi:2,5-furandicarboxylate decarboxylase 1